MAIKYPIPRPQPPIPEPPHGHDRLHYVTNPLDHAPAIDPDKGKIIRMRKTDGAPVFDSVSFIVDEIPDAEDSIHGDILFVALEKDDFDYDLEFDLND